MSLLNLSFVLTVLFARLLKYYWQKSSWTFRALPSEGECTYLHLWCAHIHGVDTVVGAYSLWVRGTEFWYVDSQKSVNSFWLLFYFCRSCWFQWPKFKMNPQATKYHVAPIINGYFPCNNIILIRNSNPLMSNEWHKVTELSYLDSE